MHHYTLQIVESTGGHRRTLPLGELPEAEARQEAERHLDGVQADKHGGRVYLYRTDRMERGEHEAMVVHGPDGTEWRN